MSRQVDRLKEESRLENVKRENIETKTKRVETEEDLGRKQALLMQGGSEL